MKFLIHFFGGFTLDDWKVAEEKLCQRYQIEIKNLQEVNQMLLSAKIAEIATLREQLKDYRQDREFYQDKLFPAPAAEVREERKEFQPIPTTRIPWTRRRFMLEKADADKVRKEAKNQADAIEAQIRAKNSRVEEKENAIQ